MTVGKIQVRRTGGESGALGEMNPVVGMTTIGMGSINKINTDGTIIVSGKNTVGGSGIAVDANDTFVFVDQASGILTGFTPDHGSWPSGVDVRLTDFRKKGFKGTTH